MKARFSILMFICLTAFCCAELSAQPARKIDAKSFDKDGLSFSYPSSWELTDQSTSEMQQIKLTTGQSSTLIFINSPLKPVTTSEQLFSLRESITEQFIENIYQKFAAENDVSPVKKEQACSGEFNVKDYAEIKISGSYQKQPGTASIYTTLPEHRFINLVLIRHDKDNAEAFAAWRTIIKTVKTITPNAKDLPAPPTMGVTSDGGGVLNGKAVSLPAPMLSGSRAQNFRNRNVRVNVTIDSDGKVIAARADTREILLRQITEQAARAARFSPTYLCGDRVTVTGIIVYQFR